MSTDIRNCLGNKLVPWHPSMLDASAGATICVAVIIARGAIAAAVPIRPVRSQADSSSHEIRTAVSRDAAEILCRGLPSAFLNMVMKALTDS